MRSELVIRFDYGTIVPWVRRVDDALVAIAGPDALCFRTPVEIARRGHDDASPSSRSTPGERIPFVLTWFPSHEDLPEPIDAEQALSDTEELLARLGRHAASTTATTTTRSTSRCSS